MFYAENKFGIEQHTSHSAVQTATEVTVHRASCGIHKDGGAEQGAASEMKK